MSNSTLKRPRYHLQVASTIPRSRADSPHSDVSTASSGPSVSEFTRKKGKFFGVAVDYVQLATRLQSYHHKRPAIDAMWECYKLREVRDDVNLSMLPEEVMNAIVEAFCELGDTEPLERLLKQELYCYGRNCWRGPPNGPQTAHEQEMWNLGCLGTIARRLWRGYYGTEPLEEREIERLRDSRMPSLCGLAKTLRIYFRLQLVLWHGKCEIAKTAKTHFPDIDRHPHDDRPPGRFEMCGAFLATSIPKARETELGHTPQGNFDLDVAVDEESEQYAAQEYPIVALPILSYIFDGRYGLVETLKTYSMPAAPENEPDDDIKAKFAKALKVLTLEPSLPMTMVQASKLAWPREIRYDTFPCPWDAPGEDGQDP